MWRSPNAGRVAHAVPRARAARGGRNRSGPTGGSAYGMPRKTWMPSSTVPRTAPRVGGDDRADDAQTQADLGDHVSSLRCTRTDGGWRPGWAGPPATASTPGGRVPRWAGARPRQGIAMTSTDRRRRPVRCSSRSSTCRARRSHAIGRRRLVQRLLDTGGCPRHPAWSRPPAGARRRCSRSGRAIRTSAAGSRGCRSTTPTTSRPGSGPTSCTRWTTVAPRIAEAPLRALRLAGLDPVDVVLPMLLNELATTEDRLRPGARRLPRARPTGGSTSRSSSCWPTCRRRCTW